MQENLGYALATAAQAWRARLTAALSADDITAPQFFVLAALLHRHNRGKDAPTQAKVAAETGTDPNTMSQIVKRLEARGLLTRERHASDARARALVFTPEGLELTTRCAARARALNDEFFAETDQAALYATLIGLAG